MIDLRYHVYSLAAVFLALTVGIVIGTSLVRPGSSASAHRTIQRYERTMGELSSEIVKAGEDCRKLEAGCGKREDFCRAVMPIVLKDRLSWRNVAIVQTGDDDLLTGSIKQALETAGAQVTSVTELNRDFSFSDEARVRQVLSACAVEAPDAASECQAKLLSIIAGAIYQGKFSDQLSKIEDEDVATFTGDYYRFNKLVVFAGGSANGDPASAVDVPLIAALAKLGVTVVGCEASEAKVSFVAIWHKAGIATVDNADTAAGQVALVFALNGEKASFGVKETAERFIPQSLEAR